MKRFNTYLIALVPLLSHLAVSGLAAPTNIPTSSSTTKDGPSRLPRTTGGDLPEIVVLDILVIETTSLPFPNNGATVSPGFYQTPQAATPLNRPMPIGPLRFTPLNKVGARMVKQRRDVDVDGKPGPVVTVDRDAPRRVVRVGGQSSKTSPTKRAVNVDRESGPIADVDKDTFRRAARVERREMACKRSINKRDVDADGSPGPVAEVDRDDARRVLVVEDGSTLSRRSIMNRKSVDQSSGSVIALDRRQDSSAPKSPNTNPNSNAQSNTNTKRPSSNGAPTDPVLGKNGIASSTPASGALKGVLGSNADGVSNGLRGVLGGSAGGPSELNIPQQLSGKVKVPGL